MNNYGSFGGGFASNPYFRQLPSTMTVTGRSPFSGFQRSFGYGIAGLDPELAEKVQKREMERISGLQGLQMGELQMQRAGLQLRQSQMEMEDLEKERQAQRTLEMDPRLRTAPEAQSAYESALRTTMGQQFEIGQKERALSSFRLGQELANAPQKAEIERQRLGALSSIYGRISSGLGQGGGATGSRPILDRLGQQRGTSYATPYSPMYDESQIIPNQSQWWMQSTSPSFPRLPSGGAFGYGETPRRF